MKKKRIIFTVTNDLCFDQRMQRICTSLANGGYDVLLVGVKPENAGPPDIAAYSLKRIPVFFKKGKLFYLEYNLKLFWWLLFQRTDCLCAIDLDTIIPVYWVSRIRNFIRVYDAHELFCEMKEVVTRPFIHRIWKSIERFYVPRFRLGYTVNQPIADIFRRDYGVQYGVIRNVPVLRVAQDSTEKEPFLLYQGAVNEGRMFEVLIPAMQFVDMPLRIYGDGNFLDKTRELISRYGLEGKVLLKGKLLPGELRTVTSRASLGFTLFENNGLSNYLSLANRFFDYVHAVTPQICVDFPVYKDLNKEAPVAVLLYTTDPAVLAEHINKALADRAGYQRMQENCMKRRLEWNWDREQELLLAFYKKILPTGG